MTDLDENAQNLRLSLRGRAKALLQVAQVATACLIIVYVQVCDSHAQVVIPSVY